MSKEIETCIVCGGKEPCSHDFDKEKENLRKAFTKTVTLKDGNAKGEGCGTCDGSGVVDSGGVTSWGWGIDIPCPECAARRAGK